jgi:hypothetical protein
LDANGNIQIVTDGPGTGNSVGAATGQYPTPDEMKTEQTALLAALQQARLEINDSKIKNKMIGLSALPVPAPGLFVFGFSRGAVAVHKFTMDDRIGAANPEWFDSKNRSVLLIDPVAGRPENDGKEHLISSHMDVLYVKSLLMDLITYAAGFGPTAPVPDPSNTEKPLGSIKFAGVAARHGSDQGQSYDPAQDRTAANKLHQIIVDIMFKEGSKGPKYKIEKLFEAFQERHKVGMYCAIEKAFNQFKDEFDREDYVEGNSLGFHNPLVQQWRDENPTVKIAPNSIEDLVRGNKGKEIFMELAKSTTNLWGTAREPRRKQHAITDIKEFAGLYLSYARKGKKFEDMIKFIGDPDNPMSSNVIINSQFEHQAEEIAAIQARLGNTTVTDQLKTFILGGIQGMVTGVTELGKTAVHGLTFSREANHLNHPHFPTPPKTDELDPEKISEDHKNKRH